MRRPFGEPAFCRRGSDYPWIGVTAGGMTRLGLSAADLQAIGRGNAKALIGTEWGPYQTQ